MPSPLSIIENRPMPKIVGRGRKKGSGVNYAILRRLVPGGNPVFDVPQNKMLSIRVTATRAKIKLKVRQLVDMDGNPNGLYAIQRLS